jgi:N-acetyl-beta-hexosaminidase
VEYFLCLNNVLRISRNLKTTPKMAMWADNVKFVKDIIDSKYQKIDAAAAEVKKSNNHEQF